VWRKTGNAWGNGPVQTSLPGQPIVLGASGQRFATSMHDGDAATGRITSPAFTLEATKLTMHLGGGTNATKLRVELWVENAIVATTSVPEPGGDTLQDVTITVPGEHRGKQAMLVFVDDSPTGHLTVDDVWIWN
jgi:fructan beta-fructosidase